MPPNPVGFALRNRRAGHDKLVWARPDLQAPENFTLTSPAFEHEAAIPERHRGRLFGANISPPLYLRIKVTHDTPRARPLAEP